jgi:hypothetical protein
LESLGNLKVESILVLGALNVLIFSLFSSRWWLILRAQGHPQPYLALSGYRLAAFGVTYFTPGTQLGGEPLQIYLLQRRGAVGHTFTSGAGGAASLADLLPGCLVAGQAPLYLAGPGARQEVPCLERLEEGQPDGFGCGAPGSAVLRATPQDALAGFVVFTGHLDAEGV